MSAIEIEQPPSERALRVEIDARNASYHIAARSCAQTVLRDKIESADWRLRMLRRLLADAEDRLAAAGSIDPDHLVEDLLALQVLLDADDLRRLERLLPSAEHRGRVLAQQGARLSDAGDVHVLAGPDLDLKIEVNRDSPWSFERWSERGEFSEYCFEGDGVRYRGLLLRPGDLILPNVNLDGNFIYSALSDPKGFCPHSAVFVILEAHGLRFPAVIETYEKGLRAVPLCVFLNARYISYAEIYRHRDIDDVTAAQASHAAYAAAADARGYNFDTTDEDRTYVCCTSVALHLYRDLGLPVFESFGAIRDPGVRANMARLDYPHLDAFFTPIDFVLSELFEFVGWIDNGQPARLVARECVEKRFRHCFAKGEIQRRRLPIMVRINHFGIRQMRAQTLIGRVVSLVMGFDHVTLPKGPDRILAIVEPLEAELGAAVRKLLPQIEARLHTAEDLDLDAWLDDPELSHRVRKLLPMRWLMGRDAG